MADRTITQVMRSITPYLILLLIVATIGSLQFGYHLAELNAPQDVITCRKKSIARAAARFALGLVGKSGTGQRQTAIWQQCIPMSEAAFATVSSVFTVGGLAGALAAGPLASTRGRVSAMRYTATSYIFGSMIETVASSAVVLGLGRLLVGAGAGASTVIVPLYISEISPPSERGLFGAMTQVSINIGIILSQTLGYFLSHDEAWRYIFGIGACIAAAQLAGLFLVPESPAWLAAHGDSAKAKSTLQRIRGSGKDVQEETADWGPGETVPSLDAEQEGLLAQGEAELPHSVAAAGPKGHVGFLQVAKDVTTRPAIVAVVGIMVTQQLCGINSVIMYSVSLLANLLPTSSALLTIIISAVNLAMTIICAPLPDRLGRKTCLLISTIGQGSSSLVLAFSILFGARVLSAIAVASFVAFFAVGLGPVPFIMASELVGQEAVGATQSWCLAANYAATFLVAQFFPIINTALNGALGGAGWVYFMFAGFAAIGAVFIAAKVPETKGKRHIDEVWGRTRRVD